MEPIRNPMNSRSKSGQKATKEHRLEEKARRIKGKNSFQR
jgi:hypothetical protein